MDLDTLIQRAKEKDPDALDTIYRTYYPQMVGICLNIIREDKKPLMWRSVFFVLMRMTRANIRLMQGAR